MSSNNYNRNLEVALKASRLQEMLNDEKRQNHNLEIALMASRLAAMNLPKESAKTAKASASKPVVAFNAAVKSTLSQGDCFFSSIFRAGTEQRLLKKINECNPLIKIGNEGEFVVSMRNLVADNADVAIRSAYDFLRMLYTASNVNSKNTLKDQMESDQGFDAWHKDLIKRYVLVKKPSPDDFLREIKNGIKTRTRYVCDIEVFTTKQILESCGISIESHNDMPSTLYKKRGDKDIIHVYNCGGFHFEYFSLTPKRGGRRSATKKAYRNYGRY